MSYVPLLDQLHQYAKDLNRAVETAREKDLELESTKAQMFKFAEDLNQTYQELKQAHLEMEQGYLDTIHRLSLAAEYKDEDTGDHIVRMSRYCSKFADVLDFTERQVRNMRYASPMHDIGKIGIPDHILLKKGRLTKEEFNVIKSHTIIGAKILSRSRAEILQVAEQIALSHHEQWDGRGYPLGLAGEAIPIEARIVAFTDTFDALTSRRPYKEPYPMDTVLEILKRERGAHFDPEMVDVFFENLEYFLQIRTEVGTDPLAIGHVVWSERDLFDM